MIESAFERWAERSLRIKSRSDEDDALSASHVGLGFGELLSVVREATITGTDGPETLTGTSGADAIDAKGGNDVIFVTQGGDDTVFGGDGNDNTLFGATLTAADQVDGGAGRDLIAIQGNYDLTLGAGNLVNVESMTMLPGSDTRFGDTANNLYAYTIRPVEENTPAGVQFTFNAATLQPGETFRFDGSAETDGRYLVYPGKGIDILKGGAGGDIFFFGEDGRFGGSDRVDAGDGNDVVVLRGNYTLAFGPNAFTNVESVSLNPAADTRFWSAGVSYRYTLASHDGNVAAGGTMTFNGARLAATETMVFDGSQESDGNFRLFGGSADDGLIGGAGTDLIYGGTGRDSIDGRGGADTFWYLAAAESTGLGFDRVFGFDYAIDRIDIPGTAGARYAGQVSGGELSTATFDADLQAALADMLGPGTSALFTPDQGNFANRIFLVVDANGAQGYQTGEDFVFELANPVSPPPLDAVFVV